MLLRLRVGAWLRLLLLLLLLLLLWAEVRKWLAPPGWVDERRDEGRELRCVRWVSWVSSEVRVVEFRREEVRGSEARRGVVEGWGPLVEWG